MQNTTTYLEQSRALMKQAYADLEAGDLYHAAENGWNAVLEILKAVAEERGWEHDSERQVLGVSSKLASEAKSATLRDRFNAAFMLRTYFGEGWLEKDWIKRELDEVQDFVSEVAGLVNGRLATTQTYIG